MSEKVYPQKARLEPRSRRRLADIAPVPDLEDEVEELDEEAIDSAVHPLRLDRKSYYRSRSESTKLQDTGFAFLGLLIASLLAIATFLPKSSVGSIGYPLLNSFLGMGTLLLIVVALAFAAFSARRLLDPDFRLSRLSLGGWGLLYLIALVALQAVGRVVDPIGENAGGTLGWALLVPIDALPTALQVILLAAILFFGLLFVFEKTPRGFVAGLIHPRSGDDSTEDEPNWLAEIAPPIEDIDEAIEPSAPAFAADREPGEWELPSLSLLSEEVQSKPTESEVARKVEIIERTLADFDVTVRVVEVNAGPAVTQYGLVPGFRERRDRRGEIIKREKVKVSEILALEKDLALELAAPSLRIEAPVPGREFVGIEVPNDKTAVVNLNRIINSASFAKLRQKTKLAVALGEDVSGRPIAADLSKMPHLLIAGQTGSGKSVCVNTIITSLLLFATPKDVRLILVDPKRVELTGYNDVPHLLRSVVVDSDKVVAVLRWVVGEMDERYKLFSSLGVRNIESFNKLCEKRTDLTPMHYIVVVIDELADLMMMAADEVERLLCRLAQLARATGIHLIVATQRPSVNVITGLIKANFPTRISFSVASQVDSRTILDTGGAEKLLGRGDMLFLPQEAPKAMRIQGAFVSDDEINAVVDWWKTQGPPEYVDQLVKAESFAPGQEESSDSRYEEALGVLREHSRISVSLLQRKLRLGYPRAARLFDTLCEDGLIGQDGSVLEQKDEDDSSDN